MDTGRGARGSLFLLPSISDEMIAVKSILIMFKDADFEKVVERLELYEPLSPGCRHSLAQMLQPRQVKRGETILKAGKKPDTLWFLLNGFAKEVAYGEKAKRVSWFYYPGDLMNSYPSFFSQLPAFRDIEMITTGTLAEISFRDLISLRREFTEMTNVIDLARDDCETQRARYASRMHTLTSRERFEQFYSEHATLFNVAKHKDITSFLGVKSDSFSRFYKG